MTSADARLARALALEDAGRPDEALAEYRRLLALDPAHADARHNLGLLLARLGRLEEAEASHREYLRSHPESTRARNDLADVLLARGRYDETIETLQGHGEATGLLRLGVALACLGRFDASRAAFHTARSRGPEDVARFAGRVAPGAELDALLSPENIFISRRYMAQGECDWSGWEGYVAEMRRAAASPAATLEPAVAFMAFHAPLSGAERHRIAQHISARIESRAPPLPPPVPRRRSRIRVGVLSPDLREHVSAHLLLPLFELLDRTRFEAYAYSLAPDDGSAIRTRIGAAADGFCDLHTLPDAAAAAAIRRDDIDILVDAAGHTTGGRFAIVAQRPARVQASYLGMAGSLGSNRVDFAIVDRCVAAPGPEWTEALAYLPHTYFLCDFRSAAPRVELARRDYGLPEDAFVFCAFHSAEKIAPDCFALWMQILRQVPRSVLWLRSLPDTAIRNLHAGAAEAGVRPERLVFAPLEIGERYRARQRLGDLLLDSLHHNAVASACDALGAGLPVLTLRGSAMASRAGESLLRAAGLPELVAPDRKAFVERAVRLAADPSALSVYRQRLQDRKAPLFDTAGRVRELEACFEEMLQVSDQSRSRL